MENNNLHCSYVLERHIKIRLQNNFKIKLDYPDLIDKTFKTTLKIAKEKYLIKIHYLSLDRTKVKAKTSFKNIKNEQQLKIMKEHLEESIKLD